MPNDTGNLNEDLNCELNNFLKDGAISQAELSAAFLAAFYNGQTTQSSLSDFLKLTNIFSSVKVPTTFDGLKRIIQGKTPDLTYTKSWFCGTCLKKSSQLNNRLQRNCDKCRTRLNMYYHLDIEQQVKTIMKKFSCSDLKHSNDSNDLKDIRDGEIYKKLLRSEDGNLVRQGRGFTYMINTALVSVRSLN